MDKNLEIATDLAKVIRQAYDGANALDEMGLALRLVNAGYRLDPYPNGKSKGELIARIETVEAERDRTRNLLRAEHDKAICKGNMALLMSYRSVHEENEPNCPICTFLAETSSVKP